MVEQEEEEDTPQRRVKHIFETMDTVSRDYRNFLQMIKSEISRNCLSLLFDHDCDFVK